MLCPYSRDTGTPYFFTLPKINHLAMKTSSFLLVITLGFLTACQKDILLESNDESASSFKSDKPILLKVSYTEEAHRRAEFSEGVAETLGMTYLEEPKSERKQVYLEVYNDLTYSQQVDYLPALGDNPADAWTLPSDMPKVQRFTYVNGMVNGYDEKQKLIFEDTYDQNYWVDVNEFTDLEEAQNYAVSAYYSPKSVAAKTISIAQAGSESYSELSPGVLEFSQQIPLPYQAEPIAARSGSSKRIPEVSSEKRYMLAKYGIVYRTEGYTPQGDLKDLEHNFYQFTKDSVLYLASSHYRNKQYSAAYDVTFLEHSDIFYSNFTIQKSR